MWTDRADMGTTKTAKQKLKYATFEGVFFNFSGAEKSFNVFKKYSKIVHCMQQILRSVFQMESLHHYIKTRGAAQQQAGQSVTRGDTD